MAEVEAGVLQEFDRLLQAGPFPLFLHRQIHQKAEARGSGEGVHGHDFPLRILLHQLPGRHGAGVDGGAEARGEADVQQVLSRLDVGLEGLLEGLHVGRGGAGHAAAPHPLIELVEGQVIVAVGGGVLVEFVAQRDVGHLPLRQKLRGDIAGGIRNDYIVGHKRSFPWGYPRQTVLMERSISSNILHYLITYAPLCQWRNYVLFPLLFRENCDIISEHSSAFRRKEAPICATTKPWWRGSSAAGKPI